MPFSHTLLALLTVTIWGCNFVVIRWGVQEFPPILFGALRFAVAALPMVVFYKLPRPYWRAVAVYALWQFAWQFGCLFSAIALGMPAGLTSLITQSHVLFTVILAALILHERTNTLQSIGLVVAFSGIVYAAINVASDTTMPWHAFALTIMGAFGLAAGNVQLRRMATVLKLEPLPPLALMSWGSLITMPVLLTLSFTIEGSTAIFTAVNKASLVGWGTVLFQAYANTLLAYGIWSWLIGKHGAIKVAPYSLLVPMFGLSSSAWFLNEAITPWKWVVFGLTIGGLGLNQWGMLRKKS